MWKTVCALLVVMVATVAGAPAQESVIDAQSRVQTDQEHTKWIDHVMRSIATIKPGMARKELFSVLTVEGGLSTRTRRRYVYKHCPYIKVEVEFSPVNEIGTGQDATSEDPDDKIVKISRPYLEYSIMD
ncbi:MAG: hypothetical protein WB799_06760 [Candidatus Sulfotelmatobacter sp.]